MTRTALSVLLLALSVTLGDAAAQSLNVDCGPSPAPTPAYGAAAGQAGVWNSIDMPSVGVGLMDLNGQPSGVSVFVSNTCDQYDCSACGVGSCTAFSGSADDFALLGSWFNADCSLEMHMVTLIGVAPGRYVVHLYTNGCPVAPAAAVIVYVGGASLSFFTQGAVFQGNWATYPYGRFPFEVLAGDQIIMRLWGTTETGFAGFQLTRLDPVGQVSCLGDGSGAACPCGNFGLPGHGCRNSAAIRGAELSAAGVASLGFDSLGFSCAYEPAGVTSILIQGDQTIAPVAFGDGLRCAGGSLKRIVVTNASSAGGFVTPANGTDSISARSAALGDAIAAGTSRVYQAYYRDPDPAFCPGPAGSTFNISNAVQIAWQN